MKTLINGFEKEEIFLPHCHQRRRNRWRNEHRWSWKQQSTKVSSLLESYWSVCTIFCWMESKTRLVIRFLKLSSTFQISSLSLYLSDTCSCFIAMKVSCNNKSLYVCATTSPWKIFLLSSLSISSLSIKLKSNRTKQSSLLSPKTLNLAAASSAQPSRWPDASAPVATPDSAPMFKPSPCYSPRHVSPTYLAALDFSLDLSETMGVHGFSGVPARRGRSRVPLRPVNHQFRVTHRRCSWL